MKTRFTAVLLAVFIALSLTAYASADTWPNFGTAVAGTDFSQPINDADGALVVALQDEDGDGISETDLPLGLALEYEIDSSTGLFRHYLRGTPLYAGDYSFILKAVFPDGSFQLLHCTIKVDPATPAVSSSQDILCNMNEDVTVSVNASVSDGGAIGYQWYVNSIPSTEGGLAIIGAVGSSCSVATGEAGDSYYYCHVTNTNNGSSTGVYSSPIHVLVKGITSISVVTMPVLTKYSEGDALNTLGLQIEALYSDGSTEVITDTSVLGIFPLVFEEAGEKDVTISYKGKTCSFKVEVEKAKDIVEIVTMPARLNYEVGDAVDITGLVLKVTRRGQETLVTSGFNWSPRIVTAEGSRTITVILEDGNSVTFNVSVAPGKKDQSISIETLPDKLTYKVGDRLDTRGLTIKVITNKDSRIVNSGYTFSPVSFTEASDNQTVTVTYGSFTATFTVKVEEDETAKPSPSPVATSSPPQSGTELIRVTPSPAENREESGPPVIIIILAAVIALAALAGAVIYIIMTRSTRNTSEKDRSAAEEASFSESSESEEAEPEEEENGSVAQEHHSSVEPDKKDYFEGLFDNDETK